MCCFAFELPRKVSRCQESQGRACGLCVHRALLLVTPFPLSSEIISDRLARRPTAQLSTSGLFPPAGSRRQTGTSRPVRQASRLRRQRRMSAAVRAALAAKRAEHRSRSSSPTKLSPALPNDDSQLPHFGRDLDASIASPFGSPKPSPRSITSLNANRSSASPTPTMDLNQKSEDDIVRLSIQTGMYLARCGNRPCCLRACLPRNRVPAASSSLTCFPLTTLLLPYCSTSGS